MLQGVQLGPVWGGQGGHRWRLAVAGLGPSTSNTSTGAVELVRAC